MHYLVGGRPERHPLIQRIEDDVAALGRVELPGIFERGIVDDGSATKSPGRKTAFR
jgi:hypothetical protein